MRYIIDFVSDVTEEQVNNYITDNNCQKIKVWDCFSTTVLVDCEQTPLKTEIVTSVINDEEEIIKPLQYPQELTFNTKYGTLDDDSTAEGEETFSTSEEKDWWKNYILAAPDFDAETVTIPRRGKHISVYIMDSGITETHPEFASTSIENVWTVTPGDYSDPNGHGTAIASVISGKSCGLSNAKLKIVKIFRSDRGTYTSELVDALDAIFNSVEPNTPAVVNCSWSIPRNEFVEERFQQLLDQGIMIIASAGNSGQPIGDVTPAAMFGVLTVGSYGPDLEPSDFSNYQGGSEISYTENPTNSGVSNVWTPGEKIWAATKEGGYGYTAGTSMSAAIASMLTAYKLSYFVGSLGYILPEYLDKPLKLVWSKNPEDYNHLTKIDPRDFHPVTNYIKPDLLDLSDPRYSEANNWLISLPQRTYETQIRTTPLALLDKITFLTRENRKKVFGALSKVAIFAEKIELLDALPDFCSFTSYGDLIVNNPPEGIYEINFNVYLDNNEPQPYTVELQVLKETITEDEINQIQLEFNVCSQQFPPLAFCPFGSTEPQPCTYGCTGANPCCFDTEFKPGVGEATECVCLN